MSVRIENRLERLENKSGKYNTPDSPNLTLVSSATNQRMKALMGVFPVYTPAAEAIIDRLMELPAKQYDKAIQLALKHDGVRKVIDHKLLLQLGQQILSKRNSNTPVQFSYEADDDGEPTVAAMQHIERKIERSARKSTRQDRLKRMWEARQRVTNGR